MAVDLGKQIGPLPLGAWLAVVAGGLGIAAFSRNESADDTEIVEDIGSPEGVGDGSVGGWEQTEPDPINNRAPTTNEEWGNLAINWLIGQGYDPAWSNSAITKALAGGRGENRLKVREYALWRAALRALGPPPYPVNVPGPPGGNSGGGKGGGRPPRTDETRIVRHRFRPGKNGKCRRCGYPKNRPWHFGWLPPGTGIHAVGRFRYATVKPAPLPGSTLRSLSVQFYGHPNGWDRIFHANRKGQRRADGTPGLIENPNRLRVGWRLIIPR